MKVQRFYRPEDISKNLGYRAGFWDTYASSEQEELDVDAVQYKCQVQRSGSPAGDFKIPFGPLTFLRSYAGRMLL